MPDLPSNPPRCYPPGAAVPASASAPDGAVVATSPSRKSRCASTSQEMPERRADARRSRTERGRQSLPPRQPQGCRPGLRDFPNLAPIRARLRATIVAKKPGQMPRPVYCVDAWDPLFHLRPNRCATFFRANGVIFCVDDMTNAAKGAVASQSICPLVSPRLLGAWRRPLGRCGHADVDCRFLLGRSAPAFYGCCRREKKARTGRGNRWLTCVLRAGACAWGMPRLRYGNAQCAKK
jgi:hypothetical protein